MAIRHIITGGYGDINTIVTGGYTPGEATAHLAVAVAEAADLGAAFEAHDPGDVHEAHDPGAVYEAAT